MRAPCLVVPVAEGERVRRRLLAEGRLRTDLRIRREADRLLIPVTEAVDWGYPLREEDFAEGYRPVRSYKDLVDLPADLRDLLPSSFDVVGDIAIVRLPAALESREGAIGAAILRSQKRLRTVCVDEGVAGTHRLRRVRVVAGEERTRTRHREHGAVFAVDVAGAYFSPRMATEHVRVARRVRPGEVVVDLFAGVGPFAVLIALHARPERVYAVDSNPAAVALLEENVRRNRAHVVEVRAGDAREVLPALPPADRFVLDLPQGAAAYLPDVLRRAKPRAAIHHYEVLAEAEVEDRKGDLEGAVATAGRTGRVEATRVVRTYAPGRNHYAFDLRIS